MISYGLNELLKKKRKKNIHVDLRFKIQRIGHTHLGTHRRKVIPFYDAYQEVCAPNLKYLEKNKNKTKTVNCFSQNICGIDKDSLTLKTSDSREGKMLCKYSLHRITT